MDQANVLQAVPFFTVADMRASVRYYVEGLGFQITRRWVVADQLRWCWLELGAAALMLQEFYKEGPDARPVPEHPGQGVVISFQCRDALALYHDFTRRGVTVSRPFVGNGLWVVGLADPDGYRLEFESPTDQPEETQYTAPAATE